MSTPVVTDKWAGNFDCDVCKRKRLVGQEFSKKALERYRKNGGPLKCKACVSKAEQDEREAAAAKQQKSIISESRVCANCTMDLEYASYNRNQWSKGPGKSKCRECVEKALAKEATQQEESKQAKLQQAKEKVQQAKVSGNAQDILKAESELAALEAEKVTGLKPVSLGRGRGRGRRFGSSGRGRGRSSKSR